jgi:prepilin signal peptidase PulO-like enzyme (type II secretory pathway)
VPHPTWIALVVSGALFGVLDAFVMHDDPQLLIDRAIGAAGAGVALGGLVVVSTGVLRRTGRLKPDEWAMGWGDPLILVGIGMFLGWRLLPVVIFLASIQGAVVGLVLKRAGKLNWDKPVSEDDPWIPPAGALPFGPFLALGGLEAAFFGGMILEHLLPLLAPIS